MATITNEHVTAVKKYQKMYPDMKIADIAKLVGISPASVGNILNGMYNNDKAVESKIPYETYRRLVMCEKIVGEIFAAMMVSDYDSEERIPFVSSKRICSIIGRYLPEEYEEKVNEIYK